MAEYSRIAKGNITVTGGNVRVVLPFRPDSVEWVNYTAMTTPTSGFVASGYWDVNMGQAAAAYQVFNATPVLTTATTLTGGIATYSAGIMLQYGPQKQIIGATAANPIVFNVTAHGYVVGDIVVFQGLYQSATTGMPQICGPQFVVSAVGDADHFSVVWPGAGGNYTALSGSPAGAYVKKVLYPFIYAPGSSVCIEAIAVGTTTVVTTSAPHNFVVGQEVAFRIPPSWGTVQLNSLPNSSIPGQPVYGFVTIVNSSTQVTVNINSTGYTAFNTNQTVASVNAGGLSFPQVLAVGDNNSGSGLFGFTSPSVNGVQTINGPAIGGAFVNNSSQGFIFGNVVAPTASQVIFYRAFLSDYSS
jgi:hypothetical protein